MKAKVTFPDKFTAVLTVSVPKRKLTWHDGLAAMGACGEAKEFAKNYKTLFSAVKAILDRGLGSEDWLFWLGDRFLTRKQWKLTSEDGDRISALLTKERCEAAEAWMVKHAEKSVSYLSNSLRDSMLNAAQEIENKL